MSLSQGDRTERERPLDADYSPDDPDAKTRDAFRRQYAAERDAERDAQVEEMRDDDGHLEYVAAQPNPKGDDGEVFRFLVRDARTGKFLGWMLGYGDSWFAQMDSEDRTGRAGATRAEAAARAWPA